MTIKKIVTKKKMQRPWAMIRPNLTLRQPVVKVPAKRTNRFMSVPTSSWFRIFRFIIAIIIVLNIILSSCCMSFFPHISFLFVCTGRWSHDMLRSLSSSICTDHNVALLFTSWLEGKYLLRNIFCIQIRFMLFHKKRLQCVQILSWLLKKKKKVQLSLRSDVCGQY